ncbi:alpha/beta hydrolase [soil metagenome]
MTETVGRLAREGAPSLAWRRVEGEGPTVVWLGGYRSDMTGTKAQALAEWAQANGRAFLRFDYSGHGASEAAFEDGTISAWREDALAVIDHLTEGPLLLVGSSMGAWIAVLAALARPERVAALMLVAPALDFTSALVEPSMTAVDRETLARDGVWADPNGQTYTRALIEDGARWTLLPGPIPIHCPVRILQGGRDESVPWRHALATAEALAGDDVVFTLVKDGDHRLSREQDIARLIAAVCDCV